MSEVLQQFEGSGAFWAVVAHVALIAASALLVLSGTAKLAAPRQLIAALTELGAPAWVGLPAVRILGAGEIMLGSILVIPLPATLVGLSSLAFGIGLASLGAVGQLRHASRPCGCFGSLLQKPIGWPTVLAGLFFAACGGLLLGGYGIHGWEYSGTIAVPLASLVMLLLTFATHRRLIRAHFTLSKWRSAEVSAR